MVESERRYQKDFSARLFVVNAQLKYFISERKVKPDYKHEWLFIFHA